MAASTHKKIVYTGFGCAGVFVALALIGIIFARQSGMNMNVRPRVVGPAEAGAALDTLRRSDLYTPLPVPLPDTWRPDRHRLTAGVWIDIPVQDLDQAQAPFADTAASAIRRALWIGQAEGAKIVTRTAPAPVRRSMGPPRPAIGTVLLALTRRLTNQDRAADALVALDSAVTLGAALARDGDLRDVVAGWRLERDAASMLAGDTVFGESGGRRAAAVRWVAWADSVLPQLRDLNRLIETAAAGPASLGQLAELAADGRLPLATRRNIVRAIEWGWADNPMEKAYGISDQRDSALRRLSREVLPPRLAADVAGALTRGRPAYMSRVLLVPIVERQRREFQEE